MEQQVGLLVALVDSKLVELHSVLVDMGMGRVMLAIILQQEHTLPVLLQVDQLVMVMLTLPQQHMETQLGDLGNLIAHLLQPLQEELVLGMEWLLVGLEWVPLQVQWVVAQLQMLRGIALQADRLNMVLILGSGHILLLVNALPNFSAWAVHTILINLVQLVWIFDLHVSVKDVSDQGFSRELRTLMSDRSGGNQEFSQYVV